MIETTGISRRDLENQLDLILAAAPFAASERLRLFLNFVVWKTYNENPKVIRAYEIAVDAFDKDAKFDPNDPYIRNIARLTRQGLSDYYKGTDSWPANQNRIEIKIPVGNYKVRFSVEQNPALTSANDTTQAHESANEQVRETQIPYTKPKNSTPTSDSPGTTGSGKPDYLKHYREAADEATKAENKQRDLPLLAVIPFSCFNASERDFGSIGEILASEIISGLMPSKQIDVISRLTTTKFKGDNVEKGIIADILHADYLLTGSYQVSGDRVVLSVELSENTTSNNDLVWTDFCRFELKSLYLSGTDRISEVVSNISMELIRHEMEAYGREPMESMRLHTAILTGTNLMHCSPERLFKQAFDLFEGVLSDHPTHPTLNTLMAQWYIYRIHRGGGWRAGDDAKLKELAWQHCEAALDKNPCHAAALTTYGLLYTQFRKSPQLGMEYYRTAERFNPNEPVTHAYKAAAHSYFGNGESAVEAAERAIRLSPCDPQLHLFETCLGAAYYCANDLELAEVHTKRAHELNSSHTSNLRTLIAVLVERDKISEAMGFTKMLLTLDPEFTTSSYEERSPNSDFDVGKRILHSLKLAGVPE